MKNYCNVSPNRNDLIEDFIADYKLFALFNAPANIIFVDNFRKNIAKFKDIFGFFQMPNNIFFACKSNKSLALMNESSKQGCGIEVSSYYELKEALKYTNRIIASGPAKDSQYLTLALENNVIISIDDIEELKEIIKLDVSANVLLRISDLIRIISRFGINISQIDECLEMIKNSKVKLLGFTFHINNYNLDHRVNAIEELLEIINKKQLNIKYIDIGGGFPVNYCKKEAYKNFLANNNENMYFRKKKFKDFYPYYNEIADEEALKYILNKIHHKLDGIEIVIEPGRSLLNDCGISIYNIKYVKHLDNGDNLIITNGNINCLSEQWFNTDYLIEPKLYKRNMDQILNEPFYASVAGNLCLEQDMITWRKIKFDYMPERNDYLIYYNTAGYQMDSNESNFHRIPLVKKLVASKINDKYELIGDEEYDSK